MKIYWSRESELWDVENTKNDSGYFPYADKFMKKYPRLAVRVFWLCWKIKGFWRKTIKFLKLKYFDS